MPNRVTVPTDLAGGWLTDLAAAGFDTGQPTAWLEEGVLAYLSPQRATAVIDTITEVSLPGSRLAKAAMPPPHPENQTYGRMRSFVGAQAEPSAGVSGVDRDNAYRLGEQGWTITIDAHADLAARYGRPFADTGDTMMRPAYVSALKRG